MKKYMVLSAATVLLAAGILYGAVTRTKAYPVKTAAVVTGEIIGIVSAEGSILESGTQQVMGMDENVVRTVLIREGDQVRQGDPLVELMDGSVLKSPMDGQVKLVNAQTGMPTFSTVPLVSVGGERDLLVKVAVPEKNISKVQPGQQVNITTMAVPGQIYSGVVEDIASYARQSVGKKNNPVVVETTVRLSGETSGLKPGYTASAEIITYQNKEALTVPFEAVITRGGKKYVWALRGEKAVMQEVEIGEETELSTELRSGAVRGETVILNPTEEIAASGRIEVVQ